jgi:hypothetical protein
MPKHLAKNKIIHVFACICFTKYVMSGFLQVNLAAILTYSWNDASLVANTGRYTGMNLTLVGNVVQAPVENCRVGTCAQFSNAGYFRFNTFNWGQHPGLTFSVWFKPLAAAGDYFARIVDVDVAFIARYADTTNMEFTTRALQAGGSYTYNSFYTTGGEWQVGVWKHTAMTLNSAGNHMVIYFNGQQAYSTVKPYPQSRDIYPAYIGEGMFQDNNGHFTGYMDELFVFNYALKPAEVLALYNVSCIYLSLSKSQLCARL